MALDAPGPGETPGAVTPGAPTLTLRRLFGEVAQTALQALVLYVLITVFVGRFEIHQVSMEPNFHEGQRVVVSQFEGVLSPWLARTAYAHDGRAAALLGPRRGQVVVFYPDVEHQQDPLIKRVVGLPGETVAIEDGAVFADGLRLDEPYLHGVTTDCYGGCGPIQLGPAEYFMLGDNRPNSRDSRSLGPVSLEHIVGRVVLRYWPLDAVQFYP
jgi:signal peptidase I